MGEIDEIINALISTVHELKVGIMDCNNQMQQGSPEQQVDLQGKIKQMHSIALKLNTGVEGLQELNKFTQEQLGQ